MNMSQGDLFGGDVSVSVDSDDSEAGAPVVQEDFEAMALMSLSESPGSYQPAASLPAEGLVM